MPDESARKWRERHRGNRVSLALVVCDGEARRYVNGERVSDSDWSRNILLVPTGLAGNVEHIRIDPNGEVD